MENIRCVNCAKMFTCGLASTDKRQCDLYLSSRMSREERERKIEELKLSKHLKTEPKKEIKEDDSEKMLAEFFFGTISIMCMGLSMFLIPAGNTQLALAIVGSFIGGIIVGRLQ